MFNFRAFILGGLAAAGLAASAHAAIIDRTFDITASNFVQTFGFDPTPPTDPVHLNFTLNFDNSADINTTTTGLTVNSFNLPYAAEWQYAAGVDDLALATNLPAWATCSSAPGTFCIFMHDVSSAAPSVVFFQNSLPTAPEYNVWRANNLTMTFTDATVGGGVPEPATWALMLLGFGGAGAAMRAARRRRPALA